MVWMEKVNIWPEKKKKKKVFLLQVKPERTETAHISEEALSRSQKQALGSFNRQVTDLAF